MRFPWALLGVDVAAEIHEVSTASVTNAVAWVASANVYGPGWTASPPPAGKTSACDDARGAVVEGAEDGDRAAVLLRVAEEELARARLDRSRAAHGVAGVYAPAAEAAGVVGVVDVVTGLFMPANAFAAACATASRSAKPSIRKAMLPGER